MDEISPEKLDAYAAGRLRGAERDAVEAALAADPELQDQVDAKRRLDAVLPALAPVDPDAEPSDEQIAAQDDLIARLSSERQRATDRLADARMAMVQDLVARGTVRSPAVAEAMARVERWAFALECDTPFDPDHAHVFSRDRDGRGLTSVSTPWVQALMLEQAGVRPGASVLEIGSGGYNAALLRELAGPDGRVVTVDLDPGAVARARAGLERTGYRDVVVLDGDGAAGASEYGPFDLIMVTATAWDIPPAWREQLTGTGRLVVPLRLLGATRSIGLDRQDDHLGGADPQVCGFVPLRGSAAAPAPIAVHELGVDLHIDDAAGVNAAGVDAAGVNAAALRAALAAAPLPVFWTGVEIDDEGGDDDHLPLAVAHPSIGMLSATERAVEAGVVERAVRAGAPVLVRADSLAYRMYRTSPHTRGCQEIGLVGHGPHARDAISDYVEALHGWDTGRADAGRTRVEVWPCGTAQRRTLWRAWSQRPHADVLVAVEPAR